MTPDKATELIRMRIAMASGRAMAAVLLGKDEVQVTDAEAIASHADHVRVLDEEKQGRAVRAAWRAAAQALDAEGLLPGILGAHLTLALSDLDKGEANGMAKPPPALVPSPKAAARIDDARGLAFQVHFAKGRHNISTEHALVAVTGLPEGLRGRKYEKVMDAPSAGLRYGQSYAALRKQLAEGEKDLGKAALEYARALGKAEAAAAGAA